jgi:hypothetical protein
MIPRSERPEFHSGRADSGPGSDPVLVLTSGRDGSALQ